MLKTPKQLLREGDSDDEAVQPTSRVTTVNPAESGDNDDDYDSDGVEVQATTGGTNLFKVFVGNLPFTAVNRDLEYLFRPFGQVVGVNLRTDRLTNKPKGFGFVTFEDETSALDAITSLNGVSFQGRPLKVNYAALRGTKGAPTVRGVFGDVVQTKTSDEWKTVAVGNAKEKKSQKQKAAANGKKIKTWDQWAGPGAF